MGQARSKERQENNILSKKTHFTKKEIHDLRHKVDATIHANNANITQQVFKETVKKYVPSVSSNDDAFLEQLYSAFDVDDNKAIDFSEFVDGLSVFMKGSPDEKLTLSFKLYDVNKDGYLTNTELERVMLKLSGTFSKENRTTEIKEMIEHMFRDFDVDNDGRLSFEEYKLSAMKEPLIVDFLEQFLAEHHISNFPRAPSRAASIRSYISNTNNGNRSPSSASKLSVRLSQAELLEYSHHQQQHRLSNNSSVAAPASPTERKQLSRPTSMTSLDAALTSMEIGDAAAKKQQPATLSSIATTATTLSNKKQS
ncbi:N-acetylglucosaminyl-phosphatidylinositol de-N-acetylase [Mucor velutinosus]|uniref:N-acetylglucosaminyl-phosphatidylinositol de-N-acetylase n=1 Tax=Mucor velutinosus TaxID=708070 RepID=A0AAN7DMN9_9FUNG|nr:N-acetylglucosaminyl-phosphatidylinositol de-N-acetylase [Mucor velutinosus]